MSHTSHHKVILDFLRSVRDNSSAFSFMSAKPKAYRLLNFIINGDYEMHKQTVVAKKLDVGEVDLSRAVTPDLNKMLATFSAEHGITPPVQLYFKTKNQYPGGHFACCDIPQSEGKSEHYISIKDLIAQLESVKEKLNIAEDRKKEPSREKYHRHIKHDVNHTGKVEVTVKFENKDGNASTSSEPNTPTPSDLATYNPQVIYPYNKNGSQNIEVIRTLLEKRQFNEANTILQQWPPHENDVIFLKQFCLLQSKPIGKLNSQEAKRIFETLASLDDPQIKDIAIHMMHIIKESYYDRYARKTPCSIPESSSYDQLKHTRQFQAINLFLK